MPVVSFICQAIGAILIAFLPLAAVAEVPLFTFVQASDSQPDTAQDQLRFEDALRVISEAGQAGALLPYPVAFVVFPGDLVERDDVPAEWSQFVNTLDTHLSANNIPFFAVPGNHDQQIAGLSNYEAFIAPAAVWDFGSAWFTGMYGRSGVTGWHGLRFIGVNNYQQAAGAISAADIAEVAARVSAAENAGENVFLVAHHAHDAGGNVALAAELESLNTMGYLRGHINGPWARPGLAGVENPNVWEVNSNAIKDKGVIVYFEVFQTFIRSYVLQLAFNPTSLPAAETLPLLQPLTLAVPDAPVASFGGSSFTGEAPLTVTFTDTSTGPATNWLWDFGDGATSNLKNPSHTFNQPGSYSISLTAANSSGSDTTFAANLVIVDPAPSTRTFVPVADARVKSTQPDKNYGQDELLRLRAGSPEYRSFLRFEVAGVGAAQILSARLELGVSDGSNDGGAVYAVSPEWDEASITFNNSPSIGGEPLWVLSSASGGATATYDVTGSIGGDGIYSFGLTTQSTNSLLASSREGGQPPMLVLELGDSLPPVVSFSASPVSGTAPHKANFVDASRFAPIAWLWDFGDGATSSSQNPEHIYAETGSYSVTLTATNSAGSGTETATDLIRVLPPIEPDAQFSADRIAGSAPLEVAFEDESSGNPTSWAWSFGDGAMTTEANPVHTYTNAGDYTVSLTVANAAGSDSRTRIDFIQVEPSPNVVVLSPSDDALVRSARPTRNYGFVDHLRVRDSDNGYSSFIQFQVTDLQGSSVAAATLRLLVTDGSPVGGTLVSTSSGWSESAVTGTARPLVMGSLNHLIGAVSAGDVIEIDVTPEITGEGTFSFGLIGGSSNSALYSSKEGLQAPELEIVLGQAQSPVAAMAVSSAAGAAPHQVEFSDTSSGPATGWTWDFGDGNVSIERNPVHVYAVAGAYTVTLTVANALGTDSVTEQDLIVVSPPPQLVTILAAGDSRLRSDRPDKNYGGDLALRVRGATDISHRSFLKFDVAGLDANPVSSVKLRLFVTNGSADGGSLFLVPADWQESTITFNSSPVLGGTPLAIAGPVNANTWIEFDLSAVVTADGSYGFGLESGSTDSALFSSKEGSNPPQILIELSP